MNVFEQAEHGAKRRVKRIRAVWHIDDNTGNPANFPCEPSFTLALGNGRFQRIWLADGLAEEQFRILQKRMVEKHGSDPASDSNSLSFCVRLPGFFSHEVEAHPERKLMKIRKEVAIAGTGKRYGADELFNAFYPVKERFMDQFWEDFEEQQKAEFAKLEEIAKRGIRRKKRLEKRILENRINAA